MSEIINQSIETVPVSVLTPHPRNSNLGDAGAIYESIEANGFYGTIVAQRSTGHVLAGNHRLQAAQMAGITEVPVCWVDLDDEQSLRLLLADNRTTRLGHDDENKLTELLAELANSETGLLGTGFTGDDLDQLISDLAGMAPGGGTGEGGDEYDTAPDEKQTRVRSGDLWQLGRHRLLSGDCMIEADVARVMDGAEIDLLFYDPPWDLELPPIEFESKNQIVFTDGRRAGDAIVKFGAPEWVFVWDCVSSWYTPNRPLQRGKFAFWYGDVSSYNFDGAHYGDAGESRTVFNSRGSYEFVPDARGKHLSDVFSQAITTLHAESEHEHSKPLDWIKMLIGNCSEGNVFDPFAGSGTALIACERLGRNSFSIELSPDYCAVVINRWESETGETATLLERNE